MMLLVIAGLAPLRHAYGASTSLVISPSTAFVGDHVEASGFTIAGNSEVRVYLEDLFVASTISDDAGQYSIEFLVPAVPCNTYFMMAVDTASGTPAYAFLTIQPKVSVTPTLASFGDYITANGYGFAAYEQITLWLNDAEVYPLSTPYTDPLGSFQTSLRVPALPNGTYAFRAQDESGNFATTFFMVVPKVITDPVSGPSGSFVFAEGYGFAAGADLTIMFDNVNVSPSLPMVVFSDGSFSVPFFVPEVPDGIYSVSASDALGNVATAPFAVPSPIMTLSPDAVSGSSVVTVEGSCFRPDTPVMLYFADTQIGGFIYPPVLSPNSISARLLAPLGGDGTTVPDEYGSFEYSFVVPTSAPGTYIVAAYQADYSSPSGLVEVASATLTILDGASLDIEVTAGTVHFRGELCEFYVKTSFEGALVNVHFIQATIYWSNGTLSQSLLSNVRRISTGFYRIPYAIVEDAPTGTYSLLIKASYITSLIDSVGAASASFLISPTLTSQAAQILSIDNDIATILVPDLSAIAANLTAIDARLIAVEGQVATIQSDLGTLKADVEAINATVVSIQGNVATIQSDLGTLETKVSAINASLVSITGTQATIQTDLGTLTTNADDIHARVTSIDNGVATVESDVGTLKVRMADSGSQMNATSIFALVAALCSVSAAALMIFTRKTPKAPSTSAVTSPSEPPSGETARTVTPQTEETQKTTTPAEAKPQTEAPAEKPQETPTQTQTETPPEKPREETPKPETTQPSPSNPPDQSTPPESSPQTEPKPQDQPQPQPEPEMIVVHLEDQPPQQN